MAFSEKPRVAIVRGPNLNRWELQTMLPLQDRYAFTCYASRGNNFPTNEIPFPITPLFSVGQMLRARAARSVLSRWMGDYHDLQGLEHHLRGSAIVHSAETSYYCTYQAARAKQRLGYRLVVTVWENIPFAVHHPATAHMKQVIHRETDKFLAVSERTKQVLLLEGVPEEKIAVVMPGLDTRHFAPSPKDPRLLERFGCAPSDTIVLFVANLYWEKGIFDGLVAFRRAWERLGKPSNLKLLLVGKGRDRVEIERWIQLLGLEGRALLLGGFPYSVMPAIHNLADVFLLPSIPTRVWQEQFGYVLVESMACGKPVLSTTSGTIPEVVGNAGVLVGTNDFLALTDALVGLLTSPDQRKQLGAVARARAEATFSTDVAADRLSREYSGEASRGHHTEA